MKLFVVGGGVVGTANCLGFRQYGHDITVTDVRTDVLARFRAQGFRVCRTTQATKVRAHVYLICVQTPISPCKLLELRYVRDAARSVGQALRRSCGPHNYPVVLLRSTVLPRTTRDVVLPILEKESGRKAGRDFGVCANPEFLRAATALEDFLNPRVVLLGGEDARMLATLTELYAPWRDRIEVVSFEVAEGAKVANNVLNAAQISALNQVRLVFRAAGIDAERAIEIASRTAQSFWDRQYGLRARPDGVYLYPFGGTCLPKETRALCGMARQLGVPDDLVTGVLAVNEHVASRERCVAAATKE